MTTCAVCYTPKYLTAHHVHPKEYKESYPNGAENINEADNLVYLCCGCHHAVHYEEELHVLQKELKGRLRRKPAVIPRDELARIQSFKDRIVQAITWLRLESTLRDKECRARIESYRTIIRMVQRIHRKQRNRSLPSSWIRNLP